MNDTATNRTKLVFHLGKQVYFVQTFKINDKIWFTVLRGSVRAVDIRRSHNILGEHGKRYTYLS